MNNNFFYPKIIFQEIQKYNNRITIPKFKTKETNSIPFIQYRKDILRFIQFYNQKHENKCMITGGIAYKIHQQDTYEDIVKNSLDIDVYAIEPILFLKHLLHYLDKKYKKTKCIYIIEALHENTYTLMIDHFKFIDSTKVSEYIYNLSLHHNTNTTNNLPMVRLDFILVDLFVK